MSISKFIVNPLSQSVARSIGKEISEEPDGGGDVLVWDAAETTTIATAAGANEMTISGSTFSSAGAVDVAATGPIQDAIGVNDRAFELALTSSSGTEALDVIIGDIFGNSVSMDVSVPVSAPAYYLVVLDANDSVQLYDSTNSLIDFGAVGSLTTDGITLVNQGAGTVAGEIISVANDWNNDWSTLLSGLTIYDWFGNNPVTYP